MQRSHKRGEQKLRCFVLPVLQTNKFCGCCGPGCQENPSPTLLPENPCPLPWKTLARRANLQKYCVLADFWEFIFPFSWEDNYWYMYSKDFRDLSSIIEISKKRECARWVIYGVIYSDHYYGSLVTFWGRKSSFIGWTPLVNWSDCYRHTYRSDPHFHIRKNELLGWGRIY